MSKLFTTRRRIAIVVGASAVVLAGGGAAFAYFTSTGNGNGNATVGSSSDWSVSAAAPTGGPLLPCNGTGCTSNTETITFTITNNSAGAQQLSTWVPTIENDGSSASGPNTTTGPFIETGGHTTQPSSSQPTPGPYAGFTDVPGCESGWFTPTVTLVNGATPTPVDVAGGGSATVTVQVAMSDSSTINQDACQGKSPDVGLSVG